MIKKSKKRMGRNVRKEISMLKAEFRNVELKPCYGDADLKKKDMDLSALRQEIYALEKEINQFASPVSI